MFREFRVEHDEVNNIMTLKREANPLKNEMPDALLMSTLLTQMSTFTAIPCATNYTIISTE